MKTHSVAWDLHQNNCSAGVGLDFIKVPSPTLALPLSAWASLLATWNITTHSHTDYTGYPTSLTGEMQSFANRCSYSIHFSIRNECFKDFVRRTPQSPTKIQQDWSVLWGNILPCGQKQASFDRAEAQPRWNCLGSLSSLSSHQLPSAPLMINSTVFFPHSLLLIHSSCLLYSVR